VGPGRRPGVERSSRRHPPRPPIPIAPFDAGAPTWLEGCLGAGVRVVEREVRAERPGPEPPLEVVDVAAAVDAGRDAAAQAAREGVTVLVGTGGSPDRGERLIEALAAAEHGPLGTLRRYGDPEIALLCGLALGAGEHGLAYVADGFAARAGAAVAIALEPDLRPRVREA
jgi:NaMN:DMB phosphoribosyltransferase